MIARSLLLILLALSLPSFATQVYVTRDAAGNITFSDNPGKDSEQHQVRELPSVPAYVAPPSSQQPARVLESSFSYTSLSIVTPTNNDTLPTGAAGNVEVYGVLSPGLRETDVLILMNNGEAIRQGRQTSFSLTNLSRGENRLQLVVKNKEGKVLISSNTVVLHVHRASVLNRQAPKPAPK